MEVLNKYYVIQYKADGWHDLSDTEYTEKEANEELKSMRRNSQYKLRKRFLRTQQDQILTASRLSTNF